MAFITEGVYNGSRSYTTRSSTIKFDTFEWQYDPAFSGGVASSLKIDDLYYWGYISRDFNDILSTFEGKTTNGLGGNDIINGGEFDDEIFGDEGNDTIFGAGGADSIWGGDGNDKLDGGTGNDRLTGEYGDDIINGGDGDDYADGGYGIDNIYGNNGSDTLYGGEGNDKLEGGEGNDIIAGGNGDDILYGDNGDDFLRGDDGDDTLNGGDGDDTLYGDSVLGESGNDILNGGNGNDELRGGEGDDTLYGDDGNDILYGGDGKNTLFGGGGDDNLNAGIGDDLLDGGDGDDSLYGFDGNDTLNGGTGDDNLAGGAHTDTLTGGEGDDVLSGGEGNDILNAGAGDDELNGGNDDDVLDGGEGTNKLDGGEGNDSAIFNYDRDQYNISLSFSEEIIVKLKSSENSQTHGTTTIINVENLIFNEIKWDGEFDVESDCPHDESNYKFTGNWQHNEATDLCETSDTFTVTNKSGTAGLQVVGATATHNNDKLTSTSGTVFATIAGVKTQLFTSNIDMNLNGGSFAVSDNGNDENDLRVAGLNVKFSNLNVLSDNVRGDIAFTLPNEFTAGKTSFEISGYGLTAIIDENGSHIGVDAKIPLPDTSFSFFNMFDVDATKMNVSYEASEDKIKIQGKFEVDSFIKKFGVDKITLDLAGKNFIQIVDGKTDIVGSLKIATDLKWGAKGWGLNEIKLDVNTIKQTVGGSVSVTLPFKTKSLDLKGSLEFTTKSGLELNSVGLDVSKLDTPIGTSGIFLQSIKGKLNHLSPSDEDPIAFTGGVGLTVGPVIDKKSLAKLDLEATIDQNQIIGNGKLVLIDTKVINATGKATLNWDKGAFLFDGNFSIVNGFIKSTNKFKANDNFDFSFKGQASLTIPKELASLTTNKLGAANYQITFSNDDDLSNDFAAGWVTKDFKGTFIDFTFSIGAKYSFDGNWSLVGLNTISQIKASAKDANPTVEEAPEWIFLFAKWENATTSDVELQVIDPNGKIIKQADFAAYKIELVDDLTSEYGKTVVVAAPLEGQYKIEVVNSADLGEVNYSAGTQNAIPQLSFGSPSTDLMQPEQVTINYEALDIDSNATLSLYYDTDKQDFDGILFKNDIAEQDGAGSYVWNLEGIGAGSYYIYGVLSDGINPMVTAYADGRIDLIGNTDLFEAMGDSTLVGANSFDKIISLSGINSLDGAANNDFIIGGIDADTLIGGDGNDVIRGDASDLMGGSDSLNGGTGDDLLMGGIGADLFKFTTNDGKDIIAQFKTDQVGFDATTGYSATATAGDFQLGIDHIELNGFATTISDNVMDAVSQGDNGAIFSAQGTEITLFGIDANQLSASDFIFIA